MEGKKVVGVLVFWGVLLSVIAIVILLVRLDQGMVFTVMLILVIGPMLALVIGAGALPIRASKKREGPHEREIIREKHTIDGRVAEAPKIYQVGQQPQGFAGMFPGLLRAAYLAGERQVMGEQQPQMLEAEVEDVTGGEWEEWSGPIVGAEDDTQS